MKLTKSDLKQIVKECLLEILSEGLGAVGTVTQSVNSRLPNTQSIYTEKMRGNPVPKKPTPHLREAVKREAGGNKMMELILADTAASTLPKMLENDRKGAPVVGGGVVEQVVASANPEDIFGEEAASKWASLAFVDSLPKK